MNKPIRKRQVLLGNITNLLKNEELDETFFAELKQRVFETMQHFTEKNKKDMTNHGCSQLSVLMNHLPGMAYKSKKDESRTMLFVSSGCFKLTGYKPEELLNNNSISFGQLILSDDKLEIKKLDKISVGETFELEYRIFDRMGKERWCWEKGELVKDAYSGETFIEGFIADITDRKIAEKELSEHTAQLKKAQAIGKIGSWKISLDTNRVAASEESVRIYGFTPKKDYSLKEVQDVVLPEFRAKLNHVLYSLINLGNSYETEYKLRRPADGQIVDIRLVAEFNPKDNTVTGIIQDITERKNAESRMQENDAIFRSLIENSNDAIYILYNRKFELINSGFQKMLGYTDSDVKKPNFDPIYFIAEESLGFINERIEKLKKGEKVSNRYEFTAITKTGEKKEVEASVSYIPFRGGTATQGILRDVTERNRNEQKIKSLSELKSLLVGLSANFIHVPVNEINHSVKKSLMKLGQFVDADRAYVFEYNFADLYCRNTFEWCSIGTSAQIGNLQHVPIDYFPEWIEKHKNGEYVNVPDVSKVPNPEFRQMLQKQDIKSLLTLPLNNEGQCVGFVGFDSVEKLFCFSNDEIEILKIYAKMLGNSFERQQRELELIEAKERAEESDLLKSAFLANVSHEIRTPMNGILGFTGLLKEPKLSGEEMEEFINVIQQSGKRMLNTIDDIISISKLESGTMEVRMSDYDIEKQLNYFYRFFKPEADQKGLQFSSENKNGVDNPIIKTDKDKLNAVLANLIKNALKYTNSGFVKLGYEIRDSEVEFFVQDSGIGIKKELLKTVFNRFMQEDNSSSKLYEGAGLGLSISEGYVHIMGGKIWAESEKGKGSRFAFTIPHFKPASKN